MQEIELKFLIPDNKLNYLKRQTHIKASKNKRLIAYYFDTPNKLLAKNGTAIRIRKEGNKWVQTIKTAGDGLTSRLEHNHILDSNSTEIAIKDNCLLPNLAIYHNTPVANIIKKLNPKKLSKDLTCQYITNVDRTTRLLKQQGSNNNQESIIEVAFDKGEIIHGTDNTKKYQIQEVELELVSGSPTFLFETAKAWCKRYDLNISTVTKAERGGLLVTNKNHSPQTKANIAQIQLNPDTPKNDTLRVLVHNCLLHILPNASTIVAGNTNIKHVKQLTLGICRLNTALTYFADFNSNINPTWIPILKQTIAHLKIYNTRDLLKNKTQNKLASIGAPHVEWTTKVGVTPIDAVRATDFQLTLLELMAFASNAQPTSSHKAYDKPHKPAKPKITKTLNKLLIRIINACDTFTTLNINEQNNVRENLHALRYLCEFVATMYDKKQVKPFLKHIKPLQGLLDEHNRNHVSYEFYLQQAKVDKDALFAVGWLLAQKEHSLDACAQALQSVKQAPTFW